MRIDYTTRKKTYPRSTTSDECVRGIRNESRAWILDPAIVKKKPRANSLSKSQRGFVLIPIVALWHRATMVIMDYGWPKTCAKRLVISNDNREHGVVTNSSRTKLLRYGYRNWGTRGKRCGR